MTKAPSLQKRETDLYATHEDFHSIFSEGLTELYKLSFLLTRDPEKAERCLVTGLDDCVTGNRVFREWARSWAKRAIVQNAIRELKPRPNHSNSPISGATFPDAKYLLTDPGLDFEMDAVFRLEDFERFVLISPCWNTTRSMTVLSFSAALPERFGKAVLALFRN